MKIITKDEVINNTRKSQYELLQARLDELKNLLSIEENKETGNLMVANHFIRINIVKLTHQIEEVYTIANLLQFKLV